MEPLAKLRRELTQQLDDMKKFVTDGHPKDYADYCKAVGSISALNLALFMLDEAEKNLIEE
jgi:hypothetical protein